MKIAILNDTHAGIRNSSEIFMNYQEKFYSEIFFPFLIENGINKILHLGDYYENRTTINFKALNSNRRVFLDRLRDHRIHMDIIPGNHDVYYKNTNKLNSLKELLGHYMSEVRIIEEPEVIDYDGCKFALIPWINPENENATVEFIKNCQADICGAHLELQGFEMQAGVLAPEGMDPALFDKFEMVFSGHYHTKSQRDNIYYFGSQMEFFWSDCNDKKYFHIFDTDTRELTAVQNPITMFEKILYDDTKPMATKNLAYLDEKFVKLIVINKSSPVEFEKFIDRIQLRNIHGLQISEDFSEFVGENVNDENIKLDNTDDLLYTYIDAVETDLDKDRIKSKVRELMIEAQTLEIV